MSECKYSVGQRVIAIDGVTSKCAEHQVGYYGHVVAAFPGVGGAWKTPVYDVQLLGRTGDRECMPFMVTPNDPYPFFENEIQAAD